MRRPRSRANKIEREVWQVHDLRAKPRRFPREPGVALRFQRGAWLVRGSVSETRRPRWVDLPADLLEVVLERLPVREDRDPAASLFGADVTGDRLRTAIGRACRDTGVATFSPHALRHRRIGLLHRQGESWAAIGERMGQRSKLVTADTYTHALIDSREVDRTKLLARVQAVQTPVQTSPLEIID